MPNFKDETEDPAQLPAVARTSVPVAVPRLA
jgi:hypothetical protein